MSHLKTDWLCVATEGDTVEAEKLNASGLSIWGKPMTITTMSL